MRNLGLLIGGKSVSGLVGLATLALAVRTLGIETFGQLVLIHTAIQAVQTVVKFQTWQAILRYGTPALQEGRLGDLKRLVLFTARLDVASSLAGAVVAGVGLWLFGERLGIAPDKIPAAAAYGLALVFMVTATSDGLLRLLDRFDLLIVEDNVRALVRLVGSAALFVAGGGLEAFLVVWFVAVAAGGLSSVTLACVQVRRHGLWCGPAPKGPLSQGFDGLWRFVWATNATTSLDMLTNHAATLVVGAMIGPAEAGLFRVARQIADALAKPVKLMANVTTPELARFIAGRRFDLLGAFIVRALRVSFGASLACFAALVVAGGWLLGIVGGQATQPAYGVMLLLGAAALVTVATFALEPTLVASGRPTIALLIRVASAVVYLPSLVGLTYISGTQGAGVAAIAAAVATATLQAAAVWSWVHAAARER